jgi:hypothetical protein
MPDAVITVMSALDDGGNNHPKNVKQSTEIQGPAEIPDDLVTQL